MAPLKSQIFHIIIITYSSSISTILAADLTNLIYKGCANQKFQDPSGISSQNLKSLYTTLISQSSLTNFHNASIGNDQLTTSITGRYQCRGDLSNSNCNVCVKKIPQTIENVCGGDTIAARVQLEGCYLVYEVVGFPATKSDEVLYKQCGTGQASGSGFDTRLESAVGEIEKGVGNGKGYYSGVFQSVNVLGQCEGDLSNDECEKCVKSAGDNARTACGSSLSGQVYLQQCYVSYTYYPSGVPGSG